MTDVVLDASALMAFLHSEPGADKVAKVLGDAVISAVNFSEVLKKKTVESLHGAKYFVEFRQDRHLICQAV